MTIGRRIRSIRAEKGLSQYDLADLSGLERSTLARIELGEVDPRISTLRKIAKALGVEVGKLLK
jgi:transcriptional regulator with XRE-family HTH domain